MFKGNLSNNLICIYWFSLMHSQSTNSICKITEFPLQSTSILQLNAFTSLRLFLFTLNNVPDILICLSHCHLYIDGMQIFKLKICGFLLQHFVNGQPSDRYPDPIPASNYEVVTPCRKPPAKRPLNFSSTPAYESKRQILSTVPYKE